MSQEYLISKQPLIRYVNRQQMSWRADPSWDAGLLPGHRRYGFSGDQIAESLLFFSDCPIYGL
jgi:hypothetical protein